MRFGSGRPISMEERVEVVSTGGWLSERAPTQAALAHTPAADAFFPSLTFQSFELMPFDLGPIHSRRLGSGPVNAGQTICDQAFTEIGVTNLNEGIIARELTPPTRVLEAGANNKGRDQLLASKALGFDPNLERLRRGGVEVFGLRLNPPTNAQIGLGCIDKIESKDVFLVAGAGMKAVAVIRRIGNVMTVLQCEPLRRAEIWA